MKVRQLELALRETLRRVTQAKSEDWREFTGDSLTPELNDLERMLQQTLDELKDGACFSTEGYAGLAKWVADWIPDDEHPLVRSVGQVERLVRETAAERI